MTPLLPDTARLVALGVCVVLLVAVEVWAWVMVARERLERRRAARMVRRIVSHYGAKR